MNRSIILFLFAFAVPSAFAEGDPQRSCYQLSADGKAWSKTPEALCVEHLENGKSLITLESGLPGSVTEISRYLLKRTAGIIGSYQYTVEDPAIENSVFNELSVRLNNALAVRFKGYRDEETSLESGTLTVGPVRFHYRTMP